jgi:GMP synthase (glutamine-hydrolysing)
MRILLLQFRKQKENYLREKETIRKAFLKFSLEPDITSLSVLSTTEKIDKNLYKKYDRVMFGGSELSFEGKNTTPDTGKETEIISENLTKFIHAIVQDTTPSLAICFGHQIFAHAHGSTIKHNTHRGKSGTFQITISKDEKDDPILSGITDKFYASFMHQDVVSVAPKNAVNLAKGDRCACGILKYASNSYTTQFHPELNHNDLYLRLKMNPQYIDDDSNIELLKTNLKNVDESQKILRNFILRL